MSILFISDLHLDENHPETTEIFLQFLKSEARQAQALYILGDFFETWIGDDNLTPFNQRIINALRASTDAGLPIYLMYGNRDFLIGKRFLRATGCQLLPDEYVVNINGVPTLLMHGDTLCTQDTKYLKARKKYRNWFVQKILLLKSLEKRRELAAGLRQASKNHTATLSDNILDVTQSEVELVMKKYGVQQLIHGHTHRQAMHQFELNSQPAMRTVLGAWHDNGNALCCDENGWRYLTIHLSS